MAFSLFSKQAPKPKPAEPARAPAAAATPAARPVAPNAAEPKHGFKTTQRLALSDDWNPRHSRIEVSDSAPGLTPVLENAALLFANGQAVPARQVLEQGLREDLETQRAVLAWLAMFDLLQRVGDRATFEQMALQYVVTFERSAPTWEDRKPAAGAVLTKPATGQGRLVALIGELSKQSGPQIDALVRAALSPSPVRLDVGALTSVDDDGARLFTTALRDLRRRGVLLQWQGLDKLRAVLDARLQTGSASDEGCWSLVLEVLQWQGDQAMFEERAVEYAITFELSPPSWESLAALQQELAEEPAADQGFDESIDLMAMTGVLAGPADAQIGKLYDFANGPDQVLIDMSGVERIDFVCAGSLYNAIQQLARRETIVHLTGASAIIRSLLLLIGIPPRHFAKRPQ